MPGVVVVLAAWEWGGLTSMSGGAATVCLPPHAVALRRTQAFWLDGRHRQAAAILYGLAAGFWLLVAPACSQPAYDSTPARWPSRAAR